MTKHFEEEEGGIPVEASSDAKQILARLPKLVVANVAVSNLRAPPVSREVVEGEIRARVLRQAFVPPQLLTDSAWDMLLELLHAEITGRRVTALILCKAASIQPGTGLRWIAALVAKGLCNRDAEGPAGSGMTVTLSQKGSEALRGYFAELASARAS